MTCYQVDMWVVIRWICEYLSGGYVSYQVDMWVVIGWIYGLLLGG